MKVEVCTIGPWEDKRAEAFDINSETKPILWATTKLVLEALSTLRFISVPEAPYIIKK
jgi:hypothetical protein